VQIDWITVAAQIANFLVLVWLLQRFLYQPITRAMTRREKEIESRLTEAKEARQTAEEEAEALRTRQADLDAEKGRILDGAKQEAQSLRERLEADLREDMETRRETWRKHLEDERGSFAKILQRSAGHQVIAITGHMLQEYARSDLDGGIASGFLERLKNLDQDRRNKLADAAARSDGAARILCSVPLQPGARGKMTRALHKVLKTDIDVQYEHDADLILGVRLMIGEQTLEWSVARHLKRLESTLDEVIDSTGPTRGAATDTAGR
jgi:F-type H+-transporting ATPase subunit b